MKDDQLIDCFQKLENSILFRMSELENNVTEKMEKLSNRVSKLEKIMMNNDEILVEDIRDVKKFLPDAMGSLHAAIIKHGIDQTRFGGNSENKKLFQRIDDVESNLNERFTKIDKNTIRIIQKTDKLPFR